MDLDYGPQLPAELRQELEAHARALGVALWQVELVGQDPDTAVGFVEAARAGHGPAFLERLDVARLENLYRIRALARRAPIWSRPRVPSGVSELLPTQ